ncbi:hypothetical protein [Paenibacillus sp. N3.4]|uniref:hypothetical protein n=1 Tax=Paenibacillus sp. N3.4 TaxID=2603222 RepID=UPI0011C85BA9|nr:hypothetical protein [Paenibacillus sp. N3.4]TXK83730.1 hypothetical protein FU659_12530 [Paenibacillus sp. N3.4]
MYIGHYSVSYATKRLEPQLPLWLLFLAVQFLDIIWSVFILLGVEKASISHEVPGMPLDLTYMPFTHSLEGALFWSLFVYLFSRYWPSWKNRSTKKSALLAFAVFSHWILDFVAHNSDLPLWADKYKVGLGLYENALLSFVIEVLLLFVSLIYYSRSTHGHGFLGKYGMYIFSIFMILLDANTVWGITPPNSQVAAGFLLFSYFLFSFIIARLEPLRSQKKQIAS